MSQFRQKRKSLCSNPAGTCLQLIFHQRFWFKFTGKSRIHLWRTSCRKGKMERVQVKTKVRYMACSFSLHCVHFRGGKVSVQLHAEQFKDRAEVIPAISLLRALPTPRVGYHNLWNDSARQGHSIISSVSRWSTSVWSCKEGFFLLTLAIWCKRLQYQAAGCVTGSRVTNLSLLRGKEEKMTSRQTITDTNTFLKSRNTAILQNTG